MEVEHQVKELPIDESLQGALEKLAKEGWILVPGKPPIGVYHLMRVKHDPSAMGMGRLSIDDSKVMVIKANGTVQ